jgi:hypothetical protein
MISFERVFREKRSLMLPLLIALAVNAALLLLAVLPLTRNVAAEEARAVEAARLRGEAEQVFARARAIVDGKSRADAELARFHSDVLPANQSEARGITYLSLQQMARAAGLTISGQTFTIREPEETGTLTLYATELTLAGTYRGIRQFIHAVEAQPSFLVIERLELATAAGQDEPLQVTVTLSTYYRTPNGR